MLYIHYDREDINKEKFIFENIKGRTLLLVPDQFTLQAERDAFFYLRKEGFLDLEVRSISRLISETLKETGGGKLDMINKYGRHMLLSKILNEKSGELKLYENQAGRNSFVDMLNNLISEIKQFDITPEELKLIAEERDVNSFLKIKLSDVAIIYNEYQKAVEGKYVDTEDLVNIFVERASASNKLKENDVWVFGFDNFTPKNRQVVMLLAGICRNVHIVVTAIKDKARDCNIFELTKRVIRQFEEEAAERGIDCVTEAIRESKDFTSDMYAYKKSSLAALEKEIYAYPISAVENDDGITLVRAANYYAEAESAAAHILGLVRGDKNSAGGKGEGLRFRDIAVICNDLDVRGTVIKRVFAQYGMNIFIDRKRSLMHSPAVLYIISLIGMTSGNFQQGDVLRFLKSGLSPLTWDEVENLENYIIQYKIRGFRWKEEFTLYDSELGEEGLEQLESSRKVIVETATAFIYSYKGTKMAAEKIRAIYNFLVDKARLPEKLEELAARQQELGLMDLAGETVQAMNYIVDIFDQIVEIMGEENISDAMLVQLLEAGFNSIEIGVLPPAADGLVLGTMQRTRTTSVKHVVVIGANDGVLPSAGTDDSILSSEEKKKLFDDDAQICKLDELKSEEEKVAIYRNLSKAQEGLWMSYSGSDADGRELRPSAVFNRIKMIFDIEPEDDIVNKGIAEELVQSRKSTARYLTEAMRIQYEMSASMNNKLHREGKQNKNVNTHQEDLDVQLERASARERELWVNVAAWYRENDPETLKMMAGGLSFTNKMEKLGADTVKKLLKKTESDELVISPSALESYARCPFAYFINYALRPTERRVFEMGARDIGEMYHNAIMESSERLTDEGIAITDKYSSWMTVERDACDVMVGEIIDSLAASDNKGVMKTDNEAGYRIERLKRICKETMWELVENVRGQKINSIVYEKLFGRGSSLPPIKIQAGDSRIYIEGKIDRADMMCDNRVKVIDYKTGNEKFRKEEVEAGWKLQLMLYLKALSEKRQPAGVYYFRIKEPYIDMSGEVRRQISEKIADKIKKNFDFIGVSVLGEDQDASNRMIGKMMTVQEFSEFTNNVDKTVNDLCARISEGDISIKPKITKEMSACTYCRFSRICMFDIAFSGCSYEKV